MNPLQILSTAALCALTFHPLYTQSDQTIEIEEVYTISQLGVVEDFHLYVPIAQDYDKRQKVQSISFSSKPQRYTIIDGSKYAVFAFYELDLRKINAITIRTEIDLFDYDLTVAQLETRSANPVKEKLNKFLKKGGIYKLKEEDIDPALLSADTDRVSKVYDIHEFVVNHIEYQFSDGDEETAQYTYETQRGDCSEYADLMVALCRHNGIPARRVSGISVERKQNEAWSKIFDSTGHAWVEVYFDEYGWVPFDPTHSDGSRIVSYKNLEPKYVYTQFSEQAQNYYWEFLGDGVVEVKAKFRARPVAGVTKR